MKYDTFNHIVIKKGIRDLSHETAFNRDYFYSFSHFQELLEFTISTFQKTTDCNALGAHSFSNLAETLIISAQQANFRGGNIRLEEIG